MQAELESDIQQDFYDCELQEGRTQVPYHLEEKDAIYDCFHFCLGAEIQPTPQLVRRFAGVELSEGDVVDRWREYLDGNHEPTETICPDPCKAKYRTGNKRFDTFNWWMDKERSKLTPAACETWLTFWRHGNAKNFVHMVSAERVAKESGLHPDTVTDAITVLVQRGYLSRCISGKKGRPTVYELHSGRYSEIGGSETGP